MVKVHINIVMETNIEENGKMTVKMVMEYTIILVIKKSTTVNGQMAKNTAMVLILMLTEIFMKEIGKMEKNMEKVLYNIHLELYMKVNG